MGWLPVLLIGCVAPARHRRMDESRCRSAFFTQHASCSDADSAAIADAAIASVLAAEGDSTNVTPLRVTGFERDEKGTTVTLLPQTAMLGG